MVLRWKSQLFAERAGKFELRRVAAGAARLQQLEKAHQPQRRSGPGVLELFIPRNSGEGSSRGRGFCFGDDVETKASFRRLLPRLDGWARGFVGGCRVERQNFVLPRRGAGFHAEKHAHGHAVGCQPGHKQLVSLELLAGDGNQAQRHAGLFVLEVGAGGAPLVGRKETRRSSQQLGGYSSRPLLRSKHTLLPDCFFRNVL